MKRVMGLLAAVAALQVVAGCGPPPRKKHIVQYATGADASSNGGTTTNTALDATGFPDVDVCADNPAAWSPVASNPNPATHGGDPVDDFLVLTYDRYVYVTDVRIYESYNPGAIVQVDLEDSTNSIPPLNLFTDSLGDGNPGCPTVFHLAIDQGETVNSYNRVAIYFDDNIIGDANINSNLLDDWPEIDAVELDGVQP